jgi:hypothetical protein
MGRLVLSIRTIVVALSLASLHAPSALAQRMAQSSFRVPSRDSGALAFASVAAQPAKPPTGEQLVAGWLGSVLVGFVAWRAFDEPSGQHSKVKDDWGYTPAAHSALAVGSFVGATTAIWGIGKRRGATGTLLGTAIGAALPTLPILFTRDDPLLPFMTAICWAPLQGFFGYMGYRVSARQIDETPTVLASDQPATPRRRSINTILPEEMAATTATNMYDALIQLRPQWFTNVRRRGLTSRDQAGVAAELIVYVDGVKQEGVESLRQLAVIGVLEVTYYDAATATNRYGTGHSAGAIAIRMSGQ